MGIPNERSRIYTFCGQENQYKSSPYFIDIWEGGGPFFPVHALFLRVGRRRTSSSRPTHKAWQREINWQSPQQDNFLFICRRTFKYDANPERLSLVSAVKQRCPESESESGTRARIEIGSSSMTWPCSSDFTLVGDDIWLFVTYIHAWPA